VALLLRFHGELRWLVALVGAAAIARFAFGWARRAEFRGGDRGLAAAFTGLLDLNLLLGLILAFGLGGGLPPHRVEHMTTMVLAVVAAHLAAIGRRSGDSPAKFRNHLLAVVVALVLILAGVVRLRGGWTW
jgi:hypothetical protein